MKPPRRPLIIIASQRFWNSLPFLFALVTLVFLVWTAVRAVVYPDDGLRNLQVTGLVNQIDPEGPSAGQFEIDDVIENVEDVSLAEAFPFYATKRPGDTVHFDVNRGGKIIPISIELRKPPPEEILERLAPLLVAFIFWIVGVGVQTFRISESTPAVFFLFFQFSALMLAAGAASYQLPPWTSGLFNFTLWLIGPLSVHFHLNFPQRMGFRHQRLVLAVLYTQAALGGIPYLVWGTKTIRALPRFGQIFAFNRLFLALTLLIAVILLIYAYRNATTPGVRGKIRLVVLGGGLSALPLVSLTILPEVLVHRPIIPYGVAFLFLGVLPLTYGYAIFRHRLIAIERHVNRGATYIVVYSFLGAFYLILYAFISQWLSTSLTEGPFLNTLLVLVLASVFVPLHQRVQRFVDTIFYGGWYDYRSAIIHITQGMEQITDLQELAQTVANRLVRTLHLEDTCVFLRDLNGDFSVIEVAPRERLKAGTMLSFSTLPMSSLTFLLKMGGELGRSSLRKALSEVELSPEEHQLLNSEQDHLWVPVIGHKQVEGLIALGPKFGGDIFSGEDLDILRVVARQIGPVMENIHLLTRLRQHAMELEQRVEERTAELHDAKERVEAILASVGDGVVVTDLVGTILTVNAAFEEQSGYAAAELAGEKLYALFAEGNDAALMEDLRGTIAEGKIWRGDLVNRRKEGGTYNVQLTMAPVRNQGGQIVSYVGSQRDITRQKELDRMKDLFVADVSHELRTPTTNISLYLELLEDAPPEKRPEYLNVVREQSYLLRKLVEDILDLSRLAMGKTKRVDFSPVDLNLLADQVVVAHRPLAESGNLLLCFKPGTGLQPVRGEHNQLARVVNNLVGNSVRYTLQGEVMVRTFQDGDRVCLEVCDTGIGIAPEDREHIFERFYRGRQVRQSKIHGTGLGLAIVKEIVDFHEGSIELSSEFGKGSTFRVWLPVCEGLE